jgi:hypothetical protein
MAEAIAGLALAANILQLLDCGAQFVSISWKIWDSGQEGLENFSSLQHLSKDLKNVVKRLQADDARQHFSSPDPDANLFTLAGQCVKVTEQLLETLDKIGVGSRGKKRKAVQAAFMLTWKKNEIDSLKKILDGFRHELTLGLVVSLR